MAFHEIDAPVELCYVGEVLPIDDDGLLGGSARYEVTRVGAETLADARSRYDGILVDAGRLSESDRGVVGALDTDRPVIAVGESGDVVASTRALSRVDAHVSISSGDVESLDAIDALFEKRRANLGMPANELLDLIFESMPVHLYVKDGAARHVRSSSYYDDPEVLLGKTDREIIDDAAFAEETYTDDLQVLSSGEPLLDEVEYNPDDEDWSLTSKVPIFDGDDIVGLLGVTRLITQRKQYERRLEREKERLEEFASIISHDLRNPLAVAQGHVDLAMDTCPETGNLDVAVTHLERMDDLIDEVLTMTRQGREIEETEPVELGSMATKCWESVATGRMTLTVTDEFEFRADPGRVRHVFENLFRNAVEHASESAQSQTPEDVAEGSSGDDGRTEVSVTVGPLDDGRGFYVADDGPGIPESERDQIFDHGYTTADDGTGLGLKIVRQVVEAHGWSISVTESGDGGARFEIDDVEDSE